MLPPLKLVPTSRRERGFLGKQDQLGHAAWLEDFVIVGADVAFIVDFEQHVGVAFFFHNPLDSVLNGTLDRFFITHSLVLAEVENAAAERARTLRRERRCIDSFYPENCSREPDCARCASGISFLILRSRGLANAIESSNR